MGSRAFLKIASPRRTFDMDLTLGRRDTVAILDMWQARLASGTATGSGVAAGSGVAGKRARLGSGHRPIAHDVRLGAAGRDRTSPSHSGKLTLGSRAE